MADRDRLLQIIRELAVVHGRVTLSSGKEADWYVDLRRITFQHEAARLIGPALLDLTADWDYDAVGGLTLGADPVAGAMLHAAPRERGLDAFAVRKMEKVHGMRRQIEGPDVAGRRVLVVDDTSTTGGSPLTAAGVLREHGATVVGVAVIVDRGAQEAVQAAGYDYRAVFSTAELLG